MTETKHEDQLRKISEINVKYGRSNPSDEIILSKPIADLHSLVTKGELSPAKIWETYTRKAVECHYKTNCLTEFIDWDSSSLSAKGPLAGVPVSIKDNFGIAGYDASMGFASRCYNPVTVDNPLIKLLKDAGAVLYTKTNVPTGMLSVLSSNKVWGTTTNTHGVNRSPGGSSSGECALISGGGSRVGVGTDIGGSVRLPAHFCGIYSLRMSHNRFPREWIDDASTPGFEGIPDVASPMAKTVADLRFFIEGVMSMKPWEYCYQLLAIPWRTRSTSGNEGTLEKKSALKKVGCLKTDKFLKLTPPIERALDIVVAALREQGIEVEEFHLPQPGQVYDQAYTSLILSDGLETAGKPLGKHEKSGDKVLDVVREYTRFPKWLRSLIEWILSCVFGQTSLAAELKEIGPHSTTRYFECVAHRERLRREFWQAWKSSGIDILLAPVFPSPALPVDQFVPDACCNYCGIFNLLDYPAGVIPVTSVDREKDKQAEELDHRKHSWQSLSYLKEYDADKMHGLPVGIQVVGMKLHDEQVLDAMEYIDGLLNV